MLELLILAINMESTEFRTQGNSLKSVNFITEKFEYLSFAKVAPQFNVVHDNGFLDALRRNCPLCKQDDLKFAFYMKKFTFNFEHRVSIRI